jgi:hypothetical protein
MKTIYSVALNALGNYDNVPFGDYETLAEAQAVYKENIRGISGFRMVRNCYDDERAYSLQLTKNVLDDEEYDMEVEVLKESKMYFVETRL